MKKYFLISILILCLASLASADADDLKTITLKGGSTLKAKVIELKDGIYTLDVPDLGRMDIPETNILSITSAPLSGSQNSSDANKDQLKQQIQNQVNQMQGSILSDPEIMMDFKEIIQDDQIQSMLTDPKLIDDVMSYDPEKIQQNKDVQELIQNKKMQELMDKIQQKYAPQK